MSGVGLQKRAEKPKGRWFYLKTGALFVLAATLVQFCVSFLVFYEIRRRLDIQISGNFWPIPFTTSFYSSKADFVWKNRVTFLSGNVKISYNALPLLIRNSIRVKMSGSAIQAKLQGDWARMQGVEDAVIDFFVADVEVAPKGLGEIYQVKAESPSFHFNIQKS